MNSEAKSMQSPLRWPLVVQASNRGEDYFQDARLVNCFAEQDPNTAEWNVQKRIGYANGQQLIANGFGRGMHTAFLPGASIPAAPITLAVVGNNTNASLFSFNSSTWSLTGASLGLTDSTGNWSWTETQGATPYVVFAGQNGHMYYSPLGVGWTAVAGLPAGRGSDILGLGYLDGTIYFMDENCKIWGSNIDDPTTWNALNVVIARKVPGGGVGLVRQLNYILALKSASMEVFYDAGNATGSPLSPIDGATTPYGCANRDTIQVIDDIVFYLTSNATASPQLVRVDSLVPTIVSFPAIERLFDQSVMPGGQSFYSWVFKHGGHRFYGITSLVVNFTLVYDIDQKLWYQWTDTTGNFFPMGSTGIGNNGSFVAYSHLFQHPSNGTIYQFEGDYEFPSDNGVVADVHIYTPNTDFGTRRRKTLHRMYIRADEYSAGNLYISHSNNDYKTFSKEVKRPLNTSSPFIENQGTFVKRAYHFRHSSPTPFRIRSADLQMDFGTI